MATKKHDDAKMDKPLMQKAVNKHESRLHPGAPKTKLACGGKVKMADGGIARGMGAARKSSGTFSRNG